MKKYRDAELRWGDSPIVNRISTIIILFGIFLLCFIWIDLHYKIQRERQMEIDGAFKETANLARTIQEHTLRTIKSADQAVLFLKYRYEEEGRDIDIPQYINKEKFGTQPVMILSVIDEEGELAASSQIPFVPANLKDREHFLVHTEADSGQLFISKPVFGRAFGKWSIQMTRRVNKPDGSFGGVAVASVNPFYFTEFYKQVDIGKNSSISLIGRDDVIRVREARQNAEIGQELTSSELTNCLVNSNIGQFIAVSPVDGIKRFYSYRAMDDYPFVVIVGIDEAEVFEKLNQRIVGYYWITGSMTVAIGIFIIMLLLSAVRRRRIAQELKEARDSLESKVEQRTQELFVLNRELTTVNEEHVAINEELQHTNQELQNENAERKRIERVLQTAREALIRKNSEITAALDTIEHTQSQLIQQEKLAGIGQLAAGVAHEINNPLGFVIGNIEMLEEYYKAFNSIITQYRELHTSLNPPEQAQLLQKLEQIMKCEKEYDLDYIFADLPELFRDTLEGLERMSSIVRGMRLFAHVDQQPGFKLYDLNEGLESTLSVAHNEIKYNAVVKKSLGNLPDIEAFGSEINQVLLNIILNAAQAIKEKNSAAMELIKISTWYDDNYVYCAIEDTGVGISSENLKNIFNPFFTTKPVGQGTGLGLSISYDIIVNHHNGEILVDSTLGKKTKFTIKLPIRR